MESDGDEFPTLAVAIFKFSRLDSCFRLARLFFQRIFSLGRSQAQRQTLLCLCVCTRDWLRFFLNRDDGCAVQLIRVLYMIRLHPTKCDLKDALGCQASSLRRAACVDIFIRDSTL